MHRSHAPDVDSCQPGLPRHVAVIMDGNNRWARQRGLPGSEGHRAGEEAVQAVIRGCGERGIPVVTLFAFSSENWRRPPEEVEHLMGLFVEALERRVDELNDRGVRLRFVGDRDAFGTTLRRGMADAEARTADNEHMTLVVAASYGGRWDLARAAAELARQVAAGERDPSTIDEQALGEQLSLGDLPPPDLLIRTGGEQRISNFILWELAYTELYFTPVLWPDFGDAELKLALEHYAGRQRRFGRSGDQIGPEKEPQC